MADSLTDMKITDYSAEVLAEMGEAVLRALERVGTEAEGYAKDLCPVDTGRLRNSITHQVDTGGDAVYIGTNVEYGPYVELGTYRQAAQPFLKPAVTGHLQTYRNIVEDELKNG